jgi:hypothetical protein
MKMSDFAHINAAETAALDFVRITDDWIRGGYQLVGSRWSDEGGLTLVGESGNENVASPGCSTRNFLIPREVYWHLLEVSGGYQDKPIEEIVRGGLLMTLEERGVNTLGDLTSLSYERVLAMLPPYGRKQEYALRELRYELAQMGLTFYYPTPQEILAGR